MKGTFFFRLFMIVFAITVSVSLFASWRIYSVADARRDGALSYRTSPLSSIPLYREAVERTFVPRRIPLSDIPEDRVILSLLLSIQQAKRDTGLFFTVSELPMPVRTSGIQPVSPAHHARNVYDAAPQPPGGSVYYSMGYPDVTYSAGITSPLKESGGNLLFRKQVVRIALAAVGLSVLLSFLVSWNFSNPASVLGKGTAAEPKENLDVRAAKRLHREVADTQKEMVLRCFVCVNGKRVFKEEMLT
jgi:hypothetical protein